MDPDGVRVFSLFFKKNLYLTLCSRQLVVCFSLYRTGHTLPNYSRAVAKYGLMLWWVHDHAHSPTIIKKDLLIGMLWYGHQCYWELYVFSQSINEPPPQIHLYPNLVLVLLRLWLIRNRNQKFIFATLVLFVIAYVATITCVVIVLVNANREYPFSVWHSMNRTT